jgi:hypothetical protein
LDPWVVNLKSWTCATDAQPNSHIRQFPQKTLAFEKLRNQDLLSAIILAQNFSTNFFSWMDGIVSR